MKSEKMRFFCNFAFEMNELNLPAYDAKLRGTREKPEILDFCVAAMWR